MAIQDDTNYTLTGAQIKDLASRIVSIAESSAQAPLVGDEAPTSTTEGEVGQLYVQGDGTVYILKDIIIESGEPNEYIWEPLGDSAKVGQSDPTASTEGKVGDVYINTDTDEVFVLTHIVEEQGSPNVYTWTSLDSPIQSVSVNGTAVTPDANKNVDLTIPEEIKTVEYTTTSAKSLFSTTRQGLYRLVNKTDSTITINFNSGGAPARKAGEIAPGGEMLVFYPQAAGTTNISEPIYVLGAGGHAESGLTNFIPIQAWWGNANSSIYTDNYQTLEPINVLTQSSTGRALDAYQGKVLNDTKADKTAFTGTDGTSAGVMGLVPAPATTDAGKVLSASGSWTTPDAGIKTLTTDDYNYHYSGSEDDGIAFWLLEEGIYLLGENNIYFYLARRSVKTYQKGTMMLVSGKNPNNGYVTLVIFQPEPSDGQGAMYGVIDSNSQNFLQAPVKIVTQYDIQNNLSTSLPGSVLGARQGVVLNERIGDLTALTTTAKASAVVAINELDAELDDVKSLSGSTAPTTTTEGEIGQFYIDTSTGDIYYLESIDETTDPDTYNWTKLATGSGGGGITELTTADYDYPTTGTKTAIAGYSLPVGLYRIAENLNFVFFHSQTGSGTRELPAGTLVVVGYYSPDTVGITAVEGNGILRSLVSIEGSGSRIDSYVTSAGLTTTIDTRVYTIAGRPSNLTTTDKSTIVAGVNELESTKAEGVDYEEGDNTSLAYIKNRPFYSTTSFTPTSLGNATLGQNYDVSWGTYPYNIYWSIMEDWSSDWNQLAGPIISAQSGEAEISTVLTTIQADPTATVRVSIDQFQMSYMDMGTGDQVVLDATCPAEGFTVGTHEYDDGGMTQTLYYAKGSLTFSNGTTTQATKVMLIADAVNGYWTLLMEKPTDFDYYMEQFGIYSGYTEFFSLVGTETVAKQLDAKYVPIDNSTITTNAQGKLVASGGPTVVQTTGTSTTNVMSQNAVTAALGNVLVNGGTTVPTSSTEGQVGTQYNCVNNGEPEIYICTAVDTSTTPNTYTWKKVGLTLQLSTTDPGEGSPLADNTLLGIYE